MPTYEYHCTECETTFTVRESIAQHEEGQEKRACPECGSTKTRRVLSRFFPDTSSKT